MCHNEYTLYTSHHSSEKQEKAGGVFLSSASGFICRVIRLFEFKFTQANVNQLEQIRKIPATQTMQMLSLFLSLTAIVPAHQESQWKVNKEHIIRARAYICIRAAKFTHIRPPNTWRTRAYVLELQIARTLTQWPATLISHKVSR